MSPMHTSQTILDVTDQYVIDDLKLDYHKQTSIRICEFPLDKVSSHITVFLPTLRLKIYLQLSRPKISRLQSSTMHFSTIIVTALFGASTLAVPAFKRALLCPGIDSTPQCCAVNALNLADLNCAPRTSCPNPFSIHPKFYPYIFCPMKTVAY